MIARACQRSRDVIHHLQDGDSLDLDGHRVLDEHLAICRECREFQGEIKLMLEGLRATPVQPFDDRGLEGVWAQTTRRAGPSRPWWTRRIPLAAAAVLAIGLAAIWRLGLPPESPTASELQTAARETRLVLGLAARALHQAERTTFRDVLGAEVSRALRRVPIAWPDGASDGRRES